MLTRALSILSKFKTNQDPHKTTNHDIIDMTSSIKLHQIASYIADLLY